jgi:hypothetical protein
VNPPANPSPGGFGAGGNNPPAAAQQGVPANVVPMAAKAPSLPAEQLWDLFTANDSRL